MMFGHCIIATVAVALATFASAQSTSRFGFGQFDSCRQPGTIALTFDDGPHTGITPYIADTLSRYGMRATFFVIGNRVRRRAWVLQRLASQGHQIANHTWSHPNMTQQSAQTMRNELGWTSYVIREAIGRSPRHFRAPYLAYNDAVRAQVEARGMTTVATNLDTNDWRQPGEDAIVNQITTALRNRSTSYIHLAHDIHAVTARSLLRVIDAIRRSGFRTVTIAECLGQSAYL